MSISTVEVHIMSYLFRYLITQEDIDEFNYLSMSLLEHFEGIGS
jgi:hypothetical protein